MAPFRAELSVAGTQTVHIEVPDPGKPAVCLNLRNGKQQVGTIVHVPLELQRIRHDGRTNQPDSVVLDTTCLDMGRAEVSE